MPVAMEPLLPVVQRSLEISFAAIALATVIGLPLASLLALGRFPLRQPLALLLALLTGLPPVVVGFVVYRLAAGLRLTLAAMVLAQAALALPLVSTLARRSLATAWKDYGRTLQTAGAGRLAALGLLAPMCWRGLAAAVLAGFGRIVTELGAVLLAGGNIPGQTRTMTTALSVTPVNDEMALALTLLLAGLGIAVAGIVAALRAGEPAM